MKKLFVALVALVAAAVFLTSKGLAQPVTVEQIPGYFATDGEFNVGPVIGSGYAPSVLVAPLGSGQGFETFCIARNTSIGFLPDTFYASVDINGVYKNGPITNTLTSLVSCN